MAVSHDPKEDDPKLGQGGKLGLLGRWVEDLWRVAEKAWIELGLAVRVVVIMALLAIIGLSVLELIHFLVAVGLLTFLLINVFVLLEVRTTIDRKHDAAIRATSAGLQAEAYRLVNAYRARITELDPTVSPALANDLTDAISAELQPFQQKLSTPDPLARDRFDLLEREMQSAVERILDSHKNSFLRDGREAAVRQICQQIRREFDTRLSPLRDEAGVPNRSLATEVKAVEQTLRDRVPAIIGLRAPLYRRESPLIGNALREELITATDGQIEKLRGKLGAPRALMWRVVQGAIVMAYIACLMLFLFFLYLYARRNAEELGIIRATYGQKEVELAPPGDAGNLVPPSPLPGEPRNDRERALVEAFKPLTWIRDAISPQGPLDGRRIAVVESKGQFDKNYGEIRCHVKTGDPGKFYVEEGAVYLFKQRDALTTYRQAGLGVEFKPDGTVNNTFFVKPDKGDKLLLVLRVRQVKPDREGRFTAFPGDFGLRVDVDE